MILSYLYFKIFYKNSKFWFLAVFLFQARPADRTGRPELVSRTCTLVHVCRPTVGSTDWKQFCSRVFWVDRPVDRLQKTVFLFRGRSTRAQRLLPAGRTADRTGRPPGLQSPNGSFLFGAILKSVFRTVFWQTFSGFYRTFSDQISLK